MLYYIQKVHHEGQPMPGEEQEDIVMTSTECTILNATCPLTGKPVTELAQPVRRYFQLFDHLTSPFDYLLHTRCYQHSHYTL